MQGCRRGGAGIGANGPAVAHSGPPWTAAEGRRQCPSVVRRGALRETWTRLRVSGGVALSRVSPTAHFAEVLVSSFAIGDVLGNEPPTASAGRNGAFQSDALQILGWQLCYLGVEHGIR